MNNSAESKGSQPIKKRAGGTTRRKGCEAVTTSPEREPEKLNQVEQELRAMKSELETLQQRNHALVEHEQTLERALREVAQNRLACHAAVAGFWSEFSETQVEGLEINDPQEDPEDETVATPLPSEDPIDDRESVYDGALTRSQAMKEALAAARAELEEANREPPPRMDQAATAQPTPDQPPPRAVAEPVDDANDLMAANPMADDVPTDWEEGLDGETAAQLRLLRRLNPNKSRAQLLAQIASKKAEPPTVKPKKKWFSWMQS